MRPEDLWRRYPVLYHIAWGGSWPSIEEHGLLSTKALLRSYGKSEAEIRKLTQQRRPDWVEIECAGRRNAVLRDQRPLTDAGLRTALRGTAEPWQWYDLINSLVFFWPTRKRLETMITARAYEEVTHDLLVVDAEILVRLERANIRLSRMNSGSTRRGAYSRDMDLFRRFEDYPFEDRWRKQGRAGAIAEVCVVDRVERIREAVIDVKRGLAGDILTELAG